MTIPKRDKKANKTKKGLKTVDGFFKGSKMFNQVQGQFHRVKLSNSGQVIVSKLGSRAAVFRVDRAHAGVPFNHLNINTKFSGLAKDPHLYIPPGTRQVSQGVAKTCQVVNKINKVAIPIAIAIDTIQVGFAIINDMKNETSRRTVETVARVGGGWFGGFGGGTSGAFIGSLILPGMGTLVGALVGAIAGGITLAVTADNVVNKIGDAYSYDIIDRKCSMCKKNFRIRKYQGEKEKAICDECNQPDDADEDGSDDEDAKQLQEKTQEDQTLATNECPADKKDGWMNAKLTWNRTDSKKCD